jgi:predicted alpha/beta-fold hydrolase
MGVPKPIYQTLVGEYEDQFGYNMHRDNPSNLLQEINSKILIVHDTDDPTIPYVDSRDIAGSFSNIELFTTEHLGHKRILADRSVVDRSIEHLLERE